MRKDTAGNPIKEIINCSCCQQDSAGNHEYNCPNDIKHNWSMLDEIPITKEDYDYYEKL